LNARALHLHGVFDSAAAVRGARKPAVDPGVAAGRGDTHPVIEHRRCRLGTVNQCHFAVQFCCLFDRCLRERGGGDPLLFALTDF